MSRAYRVKVQESIRRVVRGEDHVGTTLELLEILPGEEMGDLLREELIGRGFEEKDGILSRRQGDLTIEIDACSGEVNVRAETSEEIAIEGERHGTGDTDWGRKGREEVEARLRESLLHDLETQALARNEDARRAATDRLEKGLDDVRSELDAVVNRVTAEALKRKASRMGEIKQITEDSERGELTIVLEV